MKFWRVTVYNRLKKKEEKFLVEADNEPSKIAKILAEVHPEWEKIQIKNTKKPKGIKGWSCNEAIR